MAEGKKSFVLYVDQKETWETLSNEEAGELIKHIFKYVSDENPELSNPLLKIAFLPIKQSLKRDLKKWEEKQEQRREAGRRSAELRKINSTTVNDRSRSSNEKEQTSTVNVSGNVNDSVSVEDKSSLKNNNTSGGKVSFEDKYKFFIDMFNSITNSKYRGDQKSKGAFKARLKDGFTGTDFKNAISNAYNDDLHKENLHKYLTPEYITRSNILDRYLNMKKLEFTNEKPIF